MKKLVSLVTALAMMSGMALCASAEGTSFAKGDVDMDGVITGHDAAIVSKYADGILEMEITDEQLGLADMNGDGTVDAADAALIAENQEYTLCDINLDGHASVTEHTDLLNLVCLNSIDRRVGFGDYGVRADIDCNGVIDIYDSVDILYYYMYTAAELPTFVDGKFYMDSQAIEEDYIKQQKEMAEYLSDEELKNEIKNINSLEDWFNCRCRPSVKAKADIDGDGRVSTKDATDILTMYSKNVAGVKPITSPDYDPDVIKKADINLDGKIDVKDAAFVLNVYAMIAADIL